MVENINEKKDEFCFLELPDTYGISRGIMVSKEYYDQHKGRGFPIEIAGATCLSPRSEMIDGIALPNKDGCPNAYFYPDETTLRRHHLHSDTFSVYGDFRSKANDISSPYVFSCPRGVLSKALKKLKSFGFRIYGAFEFEFYLYKGNDSTDLKEIMNSMSLMRTSTQKEYMSFSKDVMKVMKEYGLSPECYLMEWGKGQFEITMAPAYDMEIADNALRFKELVKEVARQHGYFASFVSKPYPDAGGSSAHLNHSIWDEKGNNLFHETSSEDNLSKLMKEWIAGLQHHANALTGLSASTINCYRYLTDMYTPKNDSWGIDNRFACFRVKNTDKKSTYIENRIPGAATNPYLSLAAVIYAGLDGVNRELKLKSPPFYGDPAKQYNTEQGRLLNKLPENMRNGIKCLKEDEVIYKSIGKEFLNCFIQLREYELEKYEKAQECGNEWQWEIENYLGYM